MAVGIAQTKTTPARAAGQLQAACFAPPDLAMKADEQKPVKFDKPMTLRFPPATVAAAIPAPMRGAIRRVDLPKGKKLIALTLDMCETWSELAGYDGAIVDYLRAHNVKTTFFASGKWMATHGERTRQIMSDSLFEIGTHNWAHRNVRSLTGINLQREITAPNAVYAQERATLASYQCAAPHQAALKSIAPQPKLYRFPFGACNAEALDAVRAAGMLAIQWDVSTGDAAPTQSAAAIAHQIIASTRPGSIIIGHANGRGHHMAAALPLAIPALRAKGFEFVTVSELLQAGQPVVTETCYDSRPGDTDKYDALFVPKPLSGAAAIPPVATAPVNQLRRMRATTAP